MTNFKTISFENILLTWSVNMSESSFVTDDDYVSSCMDWERRTENRNVSDGVDLG